MYIHNRREAVAMLFPFLGRGRRQQLLVEPFPEAWLPYLQENVFLYRTLTDGEKENLQKAVLILGEEKNWEGCQGLKITDEIRVTIAAQACFLLLGLKDYYFDEVQSICVYPGTFLYQHEDPSIDLPLLGQAPHGMGVILSWWHAHWEGRRFFRHNLVLHEFAHKLAELGDPDNGTPPIEDSDFLDRWETIMAKEYERLVEHADYGRPTFLDPYGASNRAEFFAVATEAFFLQPGLLHRRHPALYQALADWYSQDPKVRPAFCPQDLSQAKTANREYSRQIIADCSKALDLNPECVYAYHFRAGYCFNEKQYDQAIADYSKMLQLTQDGNEAEIYCDRGATYCDKGSYKEALADFNEAIRLVPNYARAHWERATVYTLQKEYDQALVDFNTAIRLDPKDDTAFLKRAFVYDEMGKYDKAVRDCSRAIRLYPYSASAFSYRAAIQLLRGECEQAFADCEEALQLDPTMPEPYKHRGVVHYRRGEHTLAIADFSEAIRLDPGYLEAYRARALAYEAIGQQEQARQDRAQAEEIESRNAPT